LLDEALATVQCEPLLGYGAGVGFVARAKATPCHLDDAEVEVLIDAP